MPGLYFWDISSKIEIGKQWYNVSSWCFVASCIRSSWLKRRANIMVFVIQVSERHVHHMNQFWSVLNFRLAILSELALNLGAMQKIGGVLDKYRRFHLLLMLLTILGESVSLLHESLRVLVMQPAQLLIIDDEINICNQSQPVLDDPR